LSNKPLKLRKLSSEKKEQKYQNETVALEKCARFGYFITCLKSNAPLGVTHLPVYHPMQK